MPTEKAADSDKLDGKDASEIGLRDLRIVSSTSANNSDSSKSAFAHDPLAYVVVGAGADINGGKSGSPPNMS